MSQSPIVHDFKADLAYSHKGQSVFAPYYRSLFPDLLRIEWHNADSEDQRHGVDCAIKLPDDQLTVDEKLRGREVMYKDVLLEEYSNLDARRLGWTLDRTKTCDYIAYHIPAQRLFFFMPALLLRAAFKGSLEEWRERYGSPTAENRGYTTQNIPVPWRVLHEALDERLEAHPQCRIIDRTYMP